MDGSGWTDAPLAIIGMACRLPGAAQLDEYWNLILRAGCALGPLPPSRFDAELYYDPRKGVLGKSYTRLGGIVAEQPFNQAAYPLSAELLAGCDPVHLTLLEVAGDALKHAGIEPYEVPLRNTGVYIGNARGSLRSANAACALHAQEIARTMAESAAFRRLDPGLQQLAEQEMTVRLRETYTDPARDRVNLEANRVAGLVAEVFGLTGPAVAVDAACASSLMALSQAALSLQHGQIDMALVGGASFSGWTSLVLFSQAQALSTTGSYPFDARADGFVSSDGYAVVVVKTLARALTDGDRVWGVIRGMGLSSDGRGKSLWAPRREGQVLAIRRALACGVDASRIGYVEAHGTSTQVGDATEMSALIEALGPSLAKSNGVPVTSVKGNIGHTRETAGVAGLIKTLLAMHHRRIPRAAGFESPNPEIPWDQSPFVVPTTTVAWDPPGSGVPRRAAVDAFGIGGLNVHVLVDEEPERRPGAVHALVPDDVVGRVRVQADDTQGCPIAVVGRGAVFPGARTLDAFHDLLRSGRDPKLPVPPERWNAELFPQFATENGEWSRPRGGFITDFEYDWRKNRIPPRQIAHADPLQFMVLDAAEQALREAGRLEQGLDRETTAVVIGTGFGGDFSIALGLALRAPEFQQVLRDVLVQRGVLEDEIGRICAEFVDAIRSRYSALEDETASYSSSTLASRVTKTLDLMGGAFAIDAGGGSSLAALSAGMDLLRSGSANAVLCAGAQRGLDPCVYESYRVAGCLANVVHQPAFHAIGAGLLPGEGCGVVLLKRLADAERDGDRIHGLLHGIGAATYRSDRRQAVRTAAERALSATNSPPHAVRIIEATGLAIPDVDADESAGLQSAYRTPARTELAWIDSLSSRFGYSNGASGMCSLLKLLAEFADGQVFPANSPDSAADVIAELNGVLRVVDRPCALENDDADSRLLGAVNSVTMGGQAYHAVAECHPRQAGVKLPLDEMTDSRLLRFEAADLDELAAKLERHAGDVAEPVAHVGSASAQDRLRLVIVADDRESFEHKCDFARRSLASSGVRPVLERRGIFLGMPGGTRPRIAFAFAGQGSQYAGMLRELVRASPIAARHLRELDATLSKLQLPTFERLAWADGSQLGRKLFETQLSVLLADVLLFRVLTSCGVKPDLITAHSYGEYAALVACEAWDLEQAIEMTRLRCGAIVACGVQGGMLATNAGAAQVEVLLQAAELADRVFVANYNAPGQTIVAGCTDAVAEIALRLQGQGHETRTLPVPAPFHTPLMAPVRAALRAAVAVCPLRPPTIPFLSSVTNRFTADPQDLRDNLVEQLVRPVRYVELVQRLVDAGAAIIIEIGPRDVLTKLHRQILGDDRVGLIATDDSHATGCDQLLRVRALLECRGGSLAAEPATTRSLQATSGNERARPLSAAAESGPILHFDATARRRERNRRSSEVDRAAVTPAAGRRNGDAVSAPEQDDLADFLIRFVCEQTGYPAEVVELDAELEADLGIDSIKKAQLLGELREHFPMRPAKDLTLDAFPTLRHILEFIRDSQSAETRRVPISRLAVIAESVIVPAASGRSHAIAPLPVTGAALSQRTSVTGTGDDEAIVALNVSSFRGSPYEIGRQHGQQEESAIRRTLQKYAELLGQSLFEMRPLQAALDRSDVYFGEDGFAELSGIADAVGMPVDYVAAFNYGLSMEFQPGCTQFAVTANWNGVGGLIHAVNEDWMLALALPGTLKRMAQVRFPVGGIPFLTFSTCGELAGQNGINDCGLAVSSTLLLDRLQRDDLTPGRVHPVLVKEILQRADSIEAALEIVRQLPRCGAWSMCLSQHESDRLCYVEYDAATVTVRWADDCVESTNHCQLQSALGETPAQSCQRLDRLHELLHDEQSTSPRVSVAQAQAILRDRYDRSLGRVTPHPTKATIRRPYTQASIVMRPATREVWVTADAVPGEPPDRFHRLKLDELFRDRSTDAPQDDASTLTTVASVDPAECRARPERIMNRFVLRMLDAPLEEGHGRTQPVGGRVLLLGENPTAHVLRRQLLETGADVVSLPSCEDVDVVLQQLDQIWTDGPAPTLLLLTGRDTDAACGLDEASWRVRRQRGVVLPYLICQRWVQLVSRAKLSERPRLIAVTGMGGDLGLSGRSAAVEGGALSGLLKAIRHEFEQITVRIVDAPLEDPPQLVVKCLLKELECDVADVEVGYVCGRRRVLQPVPRTLVAGRKLVSPHGTWIVTGGGRGVTAIVARELAQRYGLKLHLIGSSVVRDIPVEWRDLNADGLREIRSHVARHAREAGEDPVAAWRAVERIRELAANLQAFARAGVSASYHACDVTDPRQLSDILDTIRAADGPIHGIIHGAGFESACRFDKKSRAAVNRTLATKVDAAVCLAALTREDPLEYCIGFGSISGRFGGQGQTDYSMSSDLLAKFMCRWRSERPTCRAVAIHWPVWGETGMAMRPESKLSLEIAGHRFMPPLEGVSHLIDELESGAPDGEVLLLDWPAARGARKAPWTPREAQAYWQRADAVAVAPLIDGLVHVNEGHRLTAELDLDPKCDPFLVYHQIDGVPILPLVVALEAFAEASRLLTSGSVVRALRNVRIHEGLRFPSGASQRARVEVAMQDGQVLCELRSDFRNRRGVVTDPSRLHVSALVEFTAIEQASVCTTAPPQGKWNDVVYEAGAVDAVDRAIWHGPPLQGLKQVCVAGDNLWGRIIAPSNADLCRSPQKTAWQLPSAVLDACLLACSVLVYVQKKPFHLPSGIDLVRFGRAPAVGESCQVAVRLREATAERATYDFTLYGDDGHLILDAHGYEATFVTVPAATP